MKQIYAFAGFLIFMILSCTEQPEERPGTLIVTGISAAKGSEIVCVDIDSGAVVNTTPIDCFVFGSTVYDPVTHGYGFVDCDTSFKLINPESGKLIRSIKLPGFVSQAVIDTKDNLLVGRYMTIDYEDDPDTIGVKSGNSGPPVYTDYVVTVNLSTGAIIAKNKINLGGGAYATTYYYDESDKHYFLYRSDNYLISINPLTGDIVREQYVGKILVNSVYNPADNTLISLSYPAPGDQRIYLMVINPENGAGISKKLIDSEEGYYANIAGYDKENNWYIAVNSKFEVVCFDVSTGDVKKRYKLKDPLTDMKFWRRLY